MKSITSYFQPLSHLGCEIFFDLFEIESSRIKTVDKTTGYICEDLLVPTVPSQLRGGVLPHDLSSTQFFWPGAIFEKLVSQTREPHSRSLVPEASPSHV